MDTNDGSECEHKFVYSGLRYADGVNYRPGSGAVNVYYGHAYFCEHCLEPRIEETETGDRNSYQNRIEGSAPASAAERLLLVPKSDREFSRW